ncbi:MAG: hypothetical protein LBT49_00140 [Prevotellaceae bacterium]|nr:hypothetical protein [Prevotellaceae bacterium]
MNESQRRNSLRGVFDRDVTANPAFSFRTKRINPTPADGQDAMDRLFKHLTAVITDKATSIRTFDMPRSVRLHWIKHHIDENKQNNMLVFSVDEPVGVRTYIYDKDEFYVIVLEPMRRKNEYYLLTAYYLCGKDKVRDKMMKKYKRRLADVV